MTSDILGKIYDYMGTVKAKYDTNMAYVKGQNPTIANDPKKGDPDNRIPIPLAKTTVDDMAGYAGRAEDRVVSFPFIDADQQDENEYEPIARDWMDYNDDAIETSELYREALANGASYELWWTSVGDQPGLPIIPEYKILKGDSVFVKWTNEVKPTMEYAVRFWKDEDAFDGKEDATIYAQVYYPGYSERWQGNGTFVRNEAEDTVYPYSIVPVLEYKINRDRLPLFEAEKKIIDTIDKIVSKSINEVDRYNALILLLPFLADAGFKQKLVDMKVIDDLAGQGDNAILPQFLEKNLGGVTDFYKWALEVMNDYYHKSTKVPDFTNQNFGTGDESGAAKAYKLLGLEYIAAMIDTYFNQTAYQRKILFDDVINAGTTGINTDDYTIQILCKRNLPVNAKEALEIAALEKGIGISDKTIFQGLPTQIVPDWKKELSMMEEWTEPAPTLPKEDVAVVKIPKPEVTA